jgi:diacylglycerol kinase (ATP)
VPLASLSHRRVLVIFNPVAGWRRRRFLKRVLAALEARGCAVTLRETNARGDAEALARAGDPVRFDLVVAAGGDGTINEVINGLRDSDLPLALIPLGTANVLAGEIGLRHRALELAEAIATGAARPVYLGQANDRRFAMMVGVGIDARVVERLDLRLKRIAGKLAYVVSALSALLRYSAERYELEIDGRRYQVAAAVIAKGHFYGGRFVLARDARLSEPSLHAVLLERSGRWNALRYAVAIARGRLDRLKDVRVIEARRVLVFGPAGEAVQADGDLAAFLPVLVGLAERPLALVGAALD